MSRMARIASIESGCYRVPLPVVLSDSTHGVAPDSARLEAHRIG